MSKFQKSAIILGAIYLVFRIVGLLMDHLSYNELTPSDFAPIIIKFAPYFIANTCFVLFLLFNALHHKSTAAKTAAIIGGVFWILLISYYILHIIHTYYCVCNGVHSAHYIFAIMKVLSIFLEALLIIAIGFFADSNRKNKVVLISSIVGIGVLLLCDLYWYVIRPLFHNIISSATPEINITTSLLNLLAMSSLIICATTVKSKK